MHRLPVAIALLSLAAGCSSGDDPTVSAAVTATTVGATSTTGAPASTTTAPPGSTTTTPLPAPVRPVVTPPPGVSRLSEGDPGSVASALAVSEGAIRDPAVPVGGLEAHGRAQQVAYRQLAVHPEWLDQVLAKVPAPFHESVRVNLGAGTELRALTKPRTELPPWRIVAPAPAEELLGYYRAAEAATGVPWNYLASIHLVETRMGRIRGTSTAGAQGPMQFLPSTWTQYGAGGDINSNRDAILAAGRLLARNGAPADMGRALFSYNRSQRYVNAVTAYASRMAADERAYFGYYHWQVYYRMTDGDRLLPVGYGG